MLVVNTNRSVRDQISPTLSRTRHRLHAVAAGAAFAFIAGLSGPAVAAAGATNASPAVQSPAVEAVADAKPITAAAKPAPVSVKAATAAAKSVATKSAAAKSAAKAVATKSVATKAKAPTAEQLHPRGIGGGQQKFTPNADQLKNAKSIVDTGKELGLPPRAWVIAVGTALQESTLNNFGHLGDANDHDSLGLFQQRPSAGWGAPKQLRDPVYASTQFYEGLINVPSWDTRRLTEAAQAVQVSAFPEHYAKWEAQAGWLISAFHGEGPYAKLANGVK